KKLKKTEEKVQVPYLLVNYLVEKINQLKVPTYGDIQKFKVLQEKLGEINSEFQAKVREIFDKHEITEVKPEDEKFEVVNAEYQELLKKSSSVSRESLQIFSKEDFERVYNGSNLNVNDALTLEYWLVK